MGGLRVIRDPEILEAAFSRSISHRFQRFSPVRRCCVTMKYAAKVLIAYELGQRMLRGVDYFVPTFAQFGLDELQSKRFINVLLG